LKFSKRAQSKSIHQTRAHLKNLKQFLLLEALHWHAAQSSDGKPIMMIQIT